MKSQEQTSRDAQTNYAAEGPTQALAMVSVRDQKGNALPPPTSTPPYCVLAPPSNHNGSGVHVVVSAENGAATDNVVATPAKPMRRPKAEMSPLVASPAQLAQLQQRSYAVVQAAPPPGKMILLGLLLLLVIVGGIAALLIVSRMQH